MKTKIIALVCFIFISIPHSDAQHVKLRLNFPISINKGPHRAAPFSGAVWIGPEWVWRVSHYECIPGYWAKPATPRAVWVPGYWSRSRRGHIWIGGHWR